MINYQKAPLPVKISLPFTLVFLFFWMSGVLLVGQYFSRKLDADKREQTIELATLVEREFERELNSLRRSARLLANDELIRRGTSNSDIRLLQQEILPSKAILDVDAIMITNRDLESLVETRALPFRDIKIQTKSVENLTVGGVDLSTVVVSEAGEAPVMIGSSPIKNEFGITGGVMLGTVLGNERLRQINESFEEQLVVLVDHKVAASTFSGDIAYDDIHLVEWDEDSATPRLIEVNNRVYLAQAITLDGLNNEHFEVVLLISQQPLNESKQALWLLILTPGIAGGLLLAGIGYWLAKRMARPIQDITRVAQNVVRDNNFDLRAPVVSQDEIGELAASLNQLILWVGEYTDALEHAAQTLEARVDERTQELSSAIAQLKDTQSQLIQTEKMSSLGQMVAGIAHEINNPISFIQGNLNPLNGYVCDLIELVETYEAAYPEPTDSVVEKREEVEIEFLAEDATKIMSSMKMGTQRVRDIIVSLRNFSRLDEAAIKDVDLCEGLDSTLLILNHRLKQGVTVVKSYEPLPSVRCSPAQINQVFTNIIANALDAMFEADTPSMQIEIVTRDLSSEQVQVCIRDNGPGMPASVRQKIFDPFFTTKPVGKGTGLGLGICFKIIQQHQGTIEVVSEVGQGTEFIVTLPKNYVSVENDSDEADARTPQAV